MVPNASAGTNDRFRLLQCPTPQVVWTPSALSAAPSRLGPYERLGEHIPRPRLVEPDQLRECDVNAARDSHQRRERRVDLATLDRANVVAMQSGLERESFLRETEPGALLTNCSAKGPVRCRTRLARDTPSCARPGGCPTTRRASICRSPADVTQSSAAFQHAFATNLRNRLLTPAHPLASPPALRPSYTYTSTTPDRPTRCPAPRPVSLPLAVRLAPRQPSAPSHLAQPTSCGVGRGRGSRV